MPPFTTEAESSVSGCDERRTALASKRVPWHVHESRLQTVVAPFSAFEDFRTQVIKLNERGLELFMLHKYQSALFHFNEAFRMITSTGSKLLDSAVDLDRSKIRADNLASGALFWAKPQPPSDFLRPMEIFGRGTPISMADIESWILIASMTLMINGALGHLAMDKLDNAEQLLLMAITLSAEDDEVDEQDLESLRRLYHVKMVLMSVYYILGQVQSQTSDGNKLNETRLRESIDSLTQSLTISDEILGENHFTTAGIYVSIGKILMREGYVRGASVSFQHATGIYNRPRTEGILGQDQNICNTMTDLEMASMLLDQGWSFGAPVA